ncbi:hypothetical protein J6590_084571 [Homalodisca vitripennis]|nr:hypothetical protein J6590_084571 [Homalodisca vitripennis]
MNTEVAIAAVIKRILSSLDAGEKALGLFCDFILPGVSVTCGMFADSDSYDASTECETHCGLPTKSPTGHGGTQAGILLDDVLPGPCVLCHIQDKTTCFES